CARTDGTCFDYW
nr:immunoglobulin heavy chain junction region [Mus musculus]